VGESPGSACAECGEPITDPLEAIGDYCSRRCRNKVTYRKKEDRAKQAKAAARGTEEAARRAEAERLRLAALRRLDEIEHEINAARSSGMTVRQTVSGGRLPQSVTATLECRGCRSPFLALMDPNDLRVSRCSPCASEIKRLTAARQAASASPVATGRAEKRALKSAEHAESCYEQDLAANAAAAEQQRQAICPRPDKKPWNFEESAEQVISFMVEAGKPRAEHLHAYRCRCGSFHVGDKRTFEVALARAGANSL
jgi:hypothetical protein